MHIALTITLGIYEIHLFFKVDATLKAMLGLCKPNYNNGYHKSQEISNTDQTDHIDQSSDLKVSVQILINTC